jgi:hypothetical protein
MVEESAAGVVAAWRLDTPGVARCSHPDDVAGVGVALLPSSLVGAAGTGDVVAVPRPW